MPPPATVLVSHPPMTVMPALSIQSKPSSPSQHIVAVTLRPGVRPVAEIVTSSPSAIPVDGVMKPSTPSVARAGSSTSGVESGGSSVLGVVVAARRSR